MPSNKWFPAFATVSLVFTTLSSCVHYTGHPLTPVQAESTFRQRSLADPALGAFVRSVNPQWTNKWPPNELDLKTATLIGAYFNPAISVARAQLNTAEAAVITAGGRPNPSIYAVGGYETFSSSPVVVRFELSLPIETARKRAYRVLEAEKFADAERIAWKEASWQVYRQVRDSWMDHIAAVEQAEAVDREYRVRTALVSLMQQRLSVGEISRPEWDQSRVEASRVAVSLRGIQGDVLETRIRLSSAMGLPESALANMHLATNEYDSPEQIERLPFARVQQQGLLNRLDIQRSLLEYAAADAHLHLEVARQYPDIQLNPGYDFDEGFHKFAFGPSFPIPVWNRNRGPIAEAEARRVEVEAQFNVLQQNAIAQLQEALAKYRSALSEFEEANTRWSVIQQDRELSMVRSVQIGQENRLALDAMRLQGIDALYVRLQALAKTRAAFSALEDAVQAPLDNVPWVQPQAEPHKGGPVHQ